MTAPRLQINPGVTINAGMTLYGYSNGGTPTPVLLLDTLNSFNWTQYIYEVQATGSHMTLKFGLRNDPNYNYIDDVTCTQYNSDYTIGPNLIVNGGFETGDFTGWTTDGGNDVNSSNPSSVVAFEGRDNVGGGNVGSDAYFYQTVSTTPGNFYILSFWAASDGGDTPGDANIEVTLTNCNVNNGATGYITAPASPATTLTFTADQITSVDGASGGSYDSTGFIGYSIGVALTTEQQTFITNLGYTGNVGLLFLGQWAAGSSDTSYNSNAIMFWNSASPTYGVLYATTLGWGGPLQGTWMMPLSATYDPNTWC
jgi:Carbohydrate binding domain